MDRSKPKGELPRRALVPHAVGRGVKWRVLAGAQAARIIGPAWIPFEAQICEDVVANHLLRHDRKLFGSVHAQN